MISLNAENDPRDNNVKGLLSNLMLLLIRAKWSPDDMANWRDTEGSRWTLTGVRVRWEPCFKDVGLPWS